MILQFALILVIQSGSGEESLAGVLTTRLASDKTRLYALNDLVELESIESNLDSINESFRLFAKDESAYSFLLMEVLAKHGNRCSLRVIAEKSKRFRSGKARVFAAVSIASLERRLEESVEIHPLIRKIIDQQSAETKEETEETKGTQLIK